MWGHAQVEALVVSAHARIADLKTGRLSRAREARLLVPELMRESRMGSSDRATEMRGQFNSSLRAAVAAKVRPTKADASIIFLHVSKRILPNKQTPPPPAKKRADTGVDSTPLRRFPVLAAYPKR